MSLTPTRLPAMFDEMASVKTGGRERLDQLPRQVFAAEAGNGLFTPPTATAAEPVPCAAKITPFAPIPARQCSITNIMPKATSCGLDQKSIGLNPEWQEWLLGLPRGWTALEPLETCSFPEWSRLHGPPLRPTSSARKAG